ncbi:MAG TPA: TIGR04283 family arsenosugar biosynthesis glycosyltransferase [Xanthobacteraceae bacterium]|jgi:rSAM/selenodomain-associated transferase 2|nr:TIGR04283 family arsenosugar biosynthesis glycosyltransferase [Xanthobacteraceae bacterium]
MKLSVVVPVLNEADGIEESLAALAPLRARGVEVVVADGGSSDATVALAHPLADVVIAAPRGRGAQMNAGAAASSGDVLLFLHSDTRLPADADALIRDALARSGAAAGPFWGRFDVRIAGAHPLFRIVAAMMNLRSRLTGIATGDQAIFMSRAAFGPGFPDIPLMEDIAMAKRLKRLAPTLCIASPVVTSGRRWEKHGVLKTILLMWWLRLAYFFGANPAWLARSYGYVPRQS